MNQGKLSGVFVTFGKYEVNLCNLKNKSKKFAH